MKRVHFIEIEDEAWCPAAVRDGATDYLQFVIAVTNPYKVVLPKLREALAQTKETQIVDLCSGGGGAWRRLLPELIAENPQIQLCLTDKYPNLAAFEAFKTEFPENLTYAETETDAARVPETLKGFRTLFTSFHHFRPDAARGILADAVKNRQGIAVFEFTQRRTLPILSMLLTPLAVWLTTPLIRPVRGSRLLLTYLIPAVPFVVGFDGVVSCLRTYTPDELKDLTGGLSGEYVWEIGEIPVKGSIVPVTYLIGFPNVEK